MPLLIAFACAAIVSCHSSLPTCCTPTSCYTQSSVIFRRWNGNAQHGERIAAHRGGSHGKQDLIKIAGCSHSVAPTWRTGPCNCHAPLTEIQLEAPRKEREGENKEKIQRVASHVVAHRASLPLFLSLTIPRAVFMAGFFLFPSLPFVSISRSGKRLGDR